MRYALSGLLAVIVSMVSAAQTPLRFEVASVKPTLQERGVSQLTDSGFTMTAAPVRTLIAFAYGGPAFRILEGESWIRQDRFEIRGTFPPLPPGGRKQKLETAQAMMRTLLAERFALRVREETRILPRFVLSIKDPKRKNAPGRLPANPACEKLRADILSGAVKPRTANDPAPPPDPTRPNCGIRSGPKGDTYSLSSDGATMEELVSTLTVYLGRYIEDRTGIQGLGFKLTFGLEQVPRLAARSPTPPSATGPTIADALATDMNLSLRSERGPVPVIVVEHVERPTPN